MKFNLFLAFFMLFVVGCAEIGLIVGPIITGVTFWINGEAHRYYEQQPDIVYRASKHALTDLGIPITKDQQKNNTYYIVAGQNNRFSIRIEKAEQKLTKFSNRINFVGDKDFAELIYKKTDEHLNIIYFDESGRPTLHPHLK